MKNSSTIQNAYNGIKIIDSMNLSVPKKRKFINVLPLMIVAFLGIYGTVFSFISIFDISTDSQKITFFTICFFALFSLILSLPGKFRFSILPILAIYIFILYKKWNKFICGFKIVFNWVYSSIYPYKSNYFRIKNISEGNAELFLILSIFIIAFIICYVSLLHPNFFLGFLCTFPFIECGLYFGKNPDIFPALMIITFWTCLMTIQYSGYRRHSSKKASGFLRKNNMFFAKPEIKFRTAGLSGLFIIIICCIIFLMTNIISDISGYSRSEKINQIRSDMKTAASEFSFDDFGESLERFSASLGIGNLRMHHRKLGVLNSVQFKGTTDLTIETDKAMLENVYLKGFTGTEYSDNTWSVFSDSLYKKYDTMFSEFYKSKTFPQDMLTNYIISKYNTDFTNLKIKTKYRNEKYNYTPYISVPSGEITYINDTTTQLENFREYSFKVSTDQITESNLYDILANGIDYNVNSSFQEYNDFVYDNYCNVPDNAEMQQIYDIFIAGTDILYQDTYQKLESIQKILSENAEYDLHSGKTPDGKDFVNYFLTENHKGYCVHFATSGVILARMAGIPARYAEGYVLLKDDFSEENLTKNDTYKIGIKDNRAHAWAEIYIDGIGWIPYEFTPSSAVAFNLNSNSQQSVTATSSANTSVTSSAVSSNTSVSSSELTSPAVSESLQQTDISSVSQNNSGVAAVNGEKTDPTVKIIFIIGISVILLLLFIFIKYLYIKSKRNKLFNQNDKAKAAIYAYNYICDLLLFINIKNDNMQYLEFAEYAQQNLPWIFTKNEFTDATYTMLKAGLSKETISKSELDNIISLSINISDMIYKKSNIIKRIYMKLIKNL